VVFDLCALLFEISNGVKPMTTRKKRILVAIRPRAITRLSNALASDFVLTFCDSLVEAKNLLADGSFDLILCGVNFDESRMFELLRHVKSNPNTEAIPFVCIKVFEGMLHAGSYDGVKSACTLLKAEAFIDFAEWGKELGKEQAAKQLRTMLHQLVS
jgi:CheY-like chemotaxis protein